MFVKKSAEAYHTFHWSLTWLSSQFGPAEVRHYEQYFQSCQLLEKFWTWSDHPYRINLETSENRGNISIKTQLLFLDDTEKTAISLEINYLPWFNKKSIASSAFLKVGGSLLMISVEVSSPSIRQF